MQQQVKYLAIGSGLRTAFYDSKTNSGPLFVEKIGASTYSLTLVEGNYSHADEPRTNGSFELVTESEIVRGYVQQQTPGRTAEGEPETIKMVLLANAPD
jgi:hypothetical protein